MKTSLFELVGKENFLADVRTHENPIEPMVRKVLKVQRKVRNGTKWIYWYWEREGVMDYGYSGVHESYIKENNLKLNVHTTTGSMPKTKTFKHRKLVLKEKQ